MQVVMDKERNLIYLFVSRHEVHSRKKWRAIIRIIIDVILFLSKQNLYFWGHRGSSDSKKQGIFLESMKLIAKCNHVMNEYLSDIQVSKKHTNVPSSNYTKPVNLTSGKKVKNLILKK